MSQDVWAGSDDLGAGIGGPSGEGASINQTFSIDVVVRNGLAFIQEAPALALGGGALIFAAQIVPSLLSIPFSVLGGVASANESPSSDLVYLLTQIINVGFSLVAIPLQMLCLAGLAVATAKYVATGEVAFGTVLTSVVPAIKGFLYGLVLLLVLSLASAAVIAPFALLGGIAFAATESPAAIVGAVVVGLIAWLPVYVYVVLGLQLGWYAAVVDGKWPLEAMTMSWNAANGARLTLGITLGVLFVGAIVAGFTIYCLIGFALVPLVIALTTSGQTIAWLLHARPEATTREWEFFKRNPPPF